MSHVSRRDSHSRRRPRPQKYGLGPDRGRRVAAQFPGLRLDPDGCADFARRAARRDSSRADRPYRAERPWRGGGRGDLRQSRSAIDLEARAGARRGDRRAGAQRPAGVRVRREPHQEDGGGRRPRREESGGDDGQDAAAGLGRRESGCRRRPRGRDLPRPASHGARERRRMIGKLRGIVDSLDEDELILDVNGVGYVVAASARTLRALPPRGAPAELLIETHVREDAIKLYGFMTAAERDWFRLLQSVQGVGAKVALGILGALTADALSGAIARQDKAMMARAPGVGPKLAARLVLELKDKAPALAPAGLGEAPAGVEREAGLPKAARDAVLALVGLGYAQAQAAAAIAKAYGELGAEAQTATLIRAGLKALAQ